VGLCGCLPMVSTRPISLPRDGSSALLLQQQSPLFQSVVELPEGLVFGMQLAYVGDTRAEESAAEASACVNALAALHCGGALKRYWPALAQATDADGAEEGAAARSRSTQKRATEGVMNAIEQNFFCPLCNVATTGERMIPLLPFPFFSLFAFLMQTPTT
jgi:hypothetical protein